MPNMILSDEKAREQIEHCLDKNFMVEAGAGSGKTTCLVKRMISEIIESDAQVEEIVAITFTKKAADELKQKFQIKLEYTLSSTNDKTIKDKLDRALENIDNCFIGTIHSFCARLLRERPIEAGIDPSFQELDNSSEILLMNESWRDYLEYVRLYDPELLSAIDDIGIKPEELTKSFTQISNYTDVDINYNKTKKPDFTTHLDRLKLLIKDSINYIPDIEPDMGYDPLQKNIRKANNCINYWDMSKELNVIKVLSPFAKAPAITLKRWTDKDIAKEIKVDFTILSQELEADMIKWWEYCYYYVLEFIKPGVKHYEALRYKRSLLSFQDLLMKAGYLLREFPEVRLYFQNKYKYLLVDEYQDTDPIQAEIIFCLTGTDRNEQVWQKLIPKPGSLFVVGDPKQSIFRFTRADLDIYNLTKTLINKSGGETLSLTSNFRSLKSVCNVLNLTYKGILLVEHDTYQAKYCPLEGVREDAVGTEFGVRCIRISAEFTTKDAIIAQDAELIAKYIKWALEGNISLARSEDELNDGCGCNPIPRDFMIILRYKDQMEVYSRELENLGVPTVISGASSFGTYPEMKKIVKIFKFLSDINSEVYLVAILRGMFFGINDDDLYKFKVNGGRFSIFSDIPDNLKDDVKMRFSNAFEKLRQYYKLTKVLSPSAVINKIINDCGVIPYTLSSEMGPRRCSSIYQLLEMVNKCEIDGCLNFKDMVRNIEDMLETKSENELSIAGDNRNAVRIMNLHKAKGLEAPVVFLANPFKSIKPRADMHNKRTEKGSLGYFCINKKVGEFNSEIIAQPCDWSIYEADEKEYLSAEEDRLLYVAGTRAKNLLIISSCDATNKKNPWERFLDNIDKDKAIDMESIIIPSLKVDYLKVDNFREEKIKINSYDKNIFKSAFIEISPSSLAEEKIIIKSGYKDRLGADFGSIMHRLYEKLIKNKNVSDNDIGRILSEYKEADDRLLVIQNLLERFKNSDIYKRIQISSKILCEIPFSIKVSSDDDILKIFKSTDEDIPKNLTNIDEEMLKSLANVEEEVVKDIASLDEAILEKIANVDKEMLKSLTNIDEDILKSLTNIDEDILKSETDIDEDIPIIISGIIDLAFKENDGWVILDYKTNALKDEEEKIVMKNHYSSQVSLYCKAFERITNEKVKSGALCFVRGIKDSSEGPEMVDVG